MTIDKAIKELTNLDKREHFAPLDDVTPAIRLGIEALKRVQSQRRPNASIIFHPLPGETKT